MLVKGDGGVVHGRAHGTLLPLLPLQVLADGLVLLAVQDVFGIGKRHLSQRHLRIRHLRGHGVLVFPGLAVCQRGRENGNAIES